MFFFNIEYPSTYIVHFLVATCVLNILKSLKSSQRFVLMLGMLHMITIFNLYVIYIACDLVDLGAHKAKLEGDQFNI